MHQQQLMSAQQAKFRRHLVLLRASHQPVFWSADDGSILHLAGSGHRFAGADPSR